MVNRVVSVDENFDFPPAVRARQNAARASINASSFGVDPTGVADSTTAILNAIQATPAGWELIFPLGVYKVASAATVTVDRRIDIDFSGSTILNARASGWCLSFRGAHEPAVGVSALSATIIPTSTANWTSTPTAGVQFTASTPPAWQRGDLVKIIADDIIPEARLSEVPGEDARLGQYFHVHSVSGTTVTLTGVLRERSLYSTNIRAARLPRHHVGVRNLNVTMSDAALAAPGTRSGLLFDSLVRPRIENVDVNRTANAALTFRSCYGYRATSVGVDLAFDSPSAGGYGYGIIDIGSSFGLIDGLLAGKVRHGFTDDSAKTVVDSDPSNYGRTYKARVVNSSVVGASSAGFDTHSFSEGVEFANCSVTGAPTGFSLRGRNHSVLDATTTEVEIPVTIQGEIDSADSFGHTVDGLTARNVTGTVINVNLRGGTHPLAGVRDTRKSYIRNVNAINVTGRGVYVKNATVEIDNVSVTWGTVVPVTAFGLVNSENSEVVARGLRLDLRDCTTTGHTVFRNRSDQFTLEDYSVAFLAAGLPAALVDSSGTGALVNLTNGTLSDPLPSTFLTGSICSWSVPIGLSVGNFGRTAGYLLGVDTNVVTNSALVPMTADAGAPTLVLDVTLTAPQNLASIPNGRRQGQQLVIWNRPASGGALTIRHGDASYNTTMLGATNKVLAAGSWVTLVWAGNTWLQIM